MLHSWENKHVLKCELDDAVVRKARQRRRAPPSPSVKQLAWSHDDMMVRLLPLCMLMDNLPMLAKDRYDAKC